MARSTLILGMTVGLIVIPARGFAEPLPDTNVEWAPHAAISISSDNDFTRDNGVLAGEGTVEAPFVIAGWAIPAGRGAAVRIQGTSAHFVIRDCRFTGEGQRGIGIVLGETGSPTATIEQVTFEGLTTGVFAYRSVGARIEGNSFIDCRRGVDGSEADGLFLQDNSFSNAVEDAVFLWRCHAGTLMANRVSGGQNAFYLDSCHGATLNGNEADTAQRGFFLWDCFDCSIIDNIVRNCDLGLALVHTSADNVVHHNIFVGNTRAATCDTSENQWDDGYPSGGNFWDTAEATDARSGPSQNLPGSDGIADSPHPIPFAGVDRFPLVEAPPAVEAGSN